MFFTCNTTKVLSAALVVDDLMPLQYGMVGDTLDALRKSNVILASSTTANAGAILYKYLSNVNNRASFLCCDKDSIMYVQDSPDFSENRDIQIGSYQCEMTYELPHDVDVDSFYSAGLKFYNISDKKLTNDRELNFFKVKGITMNRCVEKFFDQSAFKELVLTEAHSLKPAYHTLRRWIKTGELTNEHCNTVDRVTSNKRILLSARVLPYTTVITNRFKKIVLKCLEPFLPQNQLFD